MILGKSKQHLEIRINLHHLNLNYYSFSVPAPTLSIYEYPRNNNFFQGLDITFTCNINLNSAVNSPVTILAGWQRNGTDLITGINKRISVTNASDIASTSIYNTTLRFNPLDLGDVGTYTCAVTVLAQDTTFITEITVFLMRYITYF